MDIKDNMKNPRTWIWAIASLLIIFHLLKILAIVGPPIVIAQIADADNSLTLIEIKKAFTTYIQGTGSRLELNEEQIKLNFILSGIASSLFIVFSIYLGMRKNWARISIIALMALQVSWSIGRNSYFAMDFYIFYFLILLGLLTPYVSKTFKEST